MGKQPWCVKDKWWWQLQFSLHPLIIGGGVWLSATYPSYGLLCALGVAPFSFNLAMEPWVLPGDFMFMSFFHVHHVAPLLACCVTVESIGTLSFSTAQSYLWAILWSVH